VKNEDLKEILGSITVLAGIAVLVWLMLSL
jgi:hypothetical protein